MEGYEYEKTEDMSLLYHPENRAQAKAKVNVSSDRLGVRILTVFTILYYNIREKMMT
jgi:hypothetical protein